MEKKIQEIADCDSFVIIRFTHKEQAVTSNINLIGMLLAKELLQQAINERLEVENDIKIDTTRESIR